MKYVWNYEPSFVNEFCVMRLLCQWTDYTLFMRKIPQFPHFCSLFLDLKCPIVSFFCVRKDKKRLEKKCRYSQPAQLYKKCWKQCSQSPACWRGTRGILSRCSCKFRKIHRKKPVPETVLQVFSREFCEISKNTFFTDTPPSAQLGTSW